VERFGPRFDRGWLYPRDRPALTIGIAVDSPVIFLTSLPRAAERMCDHRFGRPAIARSLIHEAYYASGQTCLATWGADVL
jgi:hypothetical protein